MTGDRRSPAEIEAAITAERARLANDLDHLQDRLSVEGIMDEVRLQVRAQINDVTQQVRGQVGTVTTEIATTLRDQFSTASTTVTRAAQRNPWPFAVVGAGLAWMAYSAAMPERAPKKPQIGMAPIKPATPAKPAHYDSSPADMAAVHLEREADLWAEAVLGTESNPIPPYDPEPTWARDEEALTLSRRDKNWSS